MKKIEAFDLVILTENIEKHHLSKGDVGTVVDIHNEGEGYTIEFTTLDGETIAVVVLFARQLRPVKRGEMSHSRELAL